MQNDSAFIGVDLGTGSCKCVVVDRRGRVLGFGQGDYPANSTQQRWNEQDPQGVLLGMAASVRQAVDQAGMRPGGCAAFSVGGALHSLLALDAAARPLTGVITWADGRAARQAAALRGTPQAHELYQQTGCPIHGMFPLYKILWMREEQPEVFARAARFVTAKEYVLARLAGEWVVDYSVAAGNAMMNTHTLAWNPASLALAGVREEQLSRLAGPMEMLRLQDAELAAQMGLAPGTPLVLGCSDAVNSSLGAGAVLPGQATLMVGTSGALRLIAGQPVLHPADRSWCYAIDAQHWLVGGAINNGGVALSWLRDLFNQAFAGAAQGAGPHTAGQGAGPHAARQEASLSFDDVDSLAGSAPAGARGLVCLPFFTGERSPNWNLNARGVFFGLTLEHGASDMARAILEGVAFRFRSLDEMLAEAGCRVEQVRASGGFVHSPLWLGIMASALRREIHVPAWGETSSLGAAAWALIGARELGSLEEAGRMAPLEKTCQPNEEDAAVYDRLYPIYTQLYQSSLGAFDAIAEFQREPHSPG